MADEVTTETVATWLLAEITRGVAEQGRVAQASLVRRLREEFGAEWVWTNENHNPAIDPKVLTRMRKLPGYGGTFKWDAGASAWVRLRPNL